MKKVIGWALWSPRNAVVAGVLALLTATVVIIIGSWLVTPSAKSTATPATGTKTTRPALAGPTLPPVPSSSATPKTTTTTRTATSTPSRTTTPPAKATTTNPVATATVKPAPGNVDEAATDPAVTATVTAAATKFINTWLAGRTTPNSAWVEQLRPLSDPGLLPFLQATPSASIPNATLGSVVVENAGQSQAFTLATLSDGQKIRLSLLVKGSGWLTYDLQPAA